MENGKTEQKKSKHSPPNWTDYKSINPSLNKYQMTHKNGIKLKKLLWISYIILTMQRYRKKLRKQNKSQNILKEKTTFSPNNSILVYFSCYHPV